MVRSFGTEMLQLKEVSVKPIKTKEEDGIDVFHVSWASDELLVDDFLLIWLAG